MKIVHLMLGNWYVDGWNYQENELPRQNKQDGNDVLIVASTEVPNKLGELEYVKPSSYVNEDEISVIRIPYMKLWSQFFTVKFRAYKGLSKILNEFLPDVIFFHDTAAFELITVANYKKKHPNVRFLVDSHADENNSAKNFLSKYVLHGLVYRFFYQYAKKQIDKYFYITLETKLFVEKYYGVSKEKLVYLPLGGTLIKEKEQCKIRKQEREKLNISNLDIVFIHSGKLSKHKRTYELLTAFNKVEDNNLKLLIVGNFTDDVKEQVQELLKDNRILCLGWKSSDELTRLLCASDVYIQPGSQSVTMQNAICCGCAVALYPYISHEYLLGNAFFEIDTQESMEELFDNLLKDISVLDEMKTKSRSIALKKLDYQVLASKLYN